MAFIDQAQVAPLMNNTYAGFGAPDIASYLGVTPEQAAMLINIYQGGSPTEAQRQQLAQMARTPIDPSGPSGASDELSGIQWGMQHLAEHPMGSHYRGDFNPLAPGIAQNILLNIATGGYYGLGKGLLDASQSGKVGSGLASFNNLGPYGSLVNPVSPQAAQAGNLAGAGAGVGGAVGAEGGFQTGGYGASAGSTLDPAYFGYDPSTLASMGTTEFGQFAGGIPNNPALLGGAPAAGLAGTPGGSAGAGGASSMTGPSLGAAGAYQLSKMLGSSGAPGMPSTPAAFPIGGAMPGGPSPQQIGALASEKHPGLAPWYGMRQKGQMPPGGLAEPANAEAMNTMFQNPQMWAR